jgi:hypothetical protein
MAERALKRQLHVKHKQKWRNKKKKNAIDDIINLIPV